MGKETLTARTLKGVRWTYTETVVIVVLQLAYTAVINRLLETEDFGLMAAATLTLSFTTHFAKMGVGQAVIQKPTLDEREVGAAFAMSAGTGALFAAGVAAAGPAIAMLAFGKPELGPVLQVMGLSLFLTSLGLTGDALLRRRLDFRAVALRTIASYVVGYLVVGLSLGFAGAGVWALVGAVLSQAAVNSIGNYLATRHRITPPFAFSAYRELFGFGSRVSLISFLEFVGNNLDTLLVGRFASLSAFGQYNRGFYLVNLPLRHLTVNLSKVLHPGFSSIQSQLARVRSAYLSAITVAAAIVFPVAAGLAVSADALVATLLGQKWNVTAEILPWFALAASMRFMSHFAGILCESLGLLNKKLAWQGIYVATLMLLMFTARSLGTGVWAYAAALAAGEFIRQLGYATIVGRVLNISFVKDVGRAFAPAIFSAAAVAALAFGTETLAALLALPSPAVLVADIAVASIGMILLVRYGPLASVAVQVLARLQRAGVLGEGVPIKSWQRLPLRLAGLTDSLSQVQYP